MVNPSRIEFARLRRRWTKAGLAKALGVTSRTIQAYEAGEFEPEPERLDRIAELLNFPRPFFLVEESMPSIGEHSASFRSLSKTSDRLRGSVLNAGAIGFQLNDWIESRFNLPQADLPDLSDLSPEDAAATLRRLWGLGETPIGNMVHLLESKGVRVFSLAEETSLVDAFCIWHEHRPFVFLNTQKSAERGRFDAAHELGHLVRDIYSMKHGTARRDEMEAQANAFASAFLMPRASLTAQRPAALTLRNLIALKHHWGVSLTALVYRLNSLGLMSEWTHRNLSAELARNGYRTQEPEPMRHESSQLLTKVFGFLKERGIGKHQIARELNVSVDEINNLGFGLMITPIKADPRHNPRRMVEREGQVAGLRLVR